MRRSTKQLVDRVFWAIDYEINAARHPTDRPADIRRMHCGLQPKWRELYDECERQEREHRALGRRLNQSMKGRASVETAARYFAAMAIFREVPETRTWWTSCDIRRDWALGYALAEALSELGIMPSIVARAGAESIIAFRDLCYSKDLV